MAQHLAYITGNPKLQATLDQSITSFYYIFRSREYKKSWKVKQNGKLMRASKTQNFIVQYVGFCKIYYTFLGINTEQTA